MSNDQPSSSSGVQELIDRLHQQGLSKGQQEADTLIAKAREQAAAILDQAKEEADEIVKSAIREAQRTQVAGEEAIRLAGRDTILRLTEELSDDFVDKVRGLVGHSMRDRDFLMQLVLTATHEAIPENLRKEGHLNVQLMDDGLESPSDQQLDDFVRALGGEALRDGLTFEIIDSEVPGIRIQAIDEDLEVELSAETITHLLLKYLSPRFREIVG